MSHVPDEAFRAAVNANVPYALKRGALDAAYPAIREQVENEVRNAHLRNLGVARTDERRKVREWLERTVSSPLISPAVLEMFDHEFGNES